MLRAHVDVRREDIDVQAVLTVALWVLEISVRLGAGRRDVEGFQSPIPAVGRLRGLMTFHIHIYSI